MFAYEKKLIEWYTEKVIIYFTKMNLLIQLIVIIAIVGIVYWLSEKIALPQPFKIVLYVVMAIVAIVWLLKLVGIGTGLGI